MHFPLDILTVCLLEQGAKILQKPAHPKREFDWVTSVSDFLKNPTDQIIVPLIEGSSEESTSDDDNATISPKIICIQSKSGASSINNLQADDILACINAPISLVADRIQRFLFDVIQWNDKMAEMVDEGCISMDLLKESESMLGEYIGLSDATFSYIAHTPDIPPMDIISTYFVNNGNYPLDAIQKAQDRGLMHRWENQDWTVVHTKPNDLIPFPTINRVIKRRGSYAAHILMVADKPINATTRFLFDLLAARLETCLDRNWYREDPLDQGYVYFLESLLKGRFQDEKQLSEQAELHGIPITGVFETCVTGSAWKVGSSRYLASQILDAEPSCKIVVNDDEVLILLCTANTTSNQIDEMESNIFNVAKQLKIELGVSERISKLDLVPLAIDESRVALKYGAIKFPRYVSFDEDTHAAKFVQVAFRFRRYFPYCALDQFEGNPRFITRLLNTDNPLTRLQESDHIHGSNDLEILRTYLYCEGHINIVCKKLHMHRNTVLYRLDKIRNLLSYDLADGDVRQYLRTLFFLMA